MRTVKRPLRLPLRLVAVVFGLLLSHGAIAEVVLVVSKDNASVELKPEEVENIFLGRSSRFPDGQVAVPVDQAERSPTRQEFYARYLNKSPAQMKAHWSKIIFTGRGQPPKAFADDDEVRARVAADPRLLGYIDARAVDDSVRVLQVR